MAQLDMIVLQNVSDILQGVASAKFNVPNVSVLDPGLDIIRKKSPIPQG